MITDSNIIDCTSFIYKITIGKYFYYGQSTNFQKRMNKHLSGLKNKNHYNKKMQDVYNKHGDFKMQIVEILGRGLSQKDLNDAEQKYIDQHWGKKTLINIAKIAGGAPDPSKPCIITIHGISKEYESTLAAGKALGKHQTQISKWIAGEVKWPTGWSGNFKGEPTNICTVGIHGGDRTKPKPFYLKGILYTCSQTEAVKKSGFPRNQQWLSACLNGIANWPDDWYGHFEGEEPKQCPKPRRNKK